MIEIQKGGYGVYITPYMSVVEINTMSRKRDLAVELLRIYACFIVIGTHIKLTEFIRPDGSIDKMLVFISDFFTGEGVGVFFLIMGFFYFNNKSTSKLFIRTLTRIVLPVAIYVLSTQIWYNCAIGIDGVIRNIQWEAIISDITSWSLSDIGYCEHLWYIFSYIQIILWFPVLRHLSSQEAAKTRRYVIILSMVGLTILNIQKMFHFSFGVIQPYFLFNIYIVVMLIGFEIYKYKDQLKNKTWIKVGSLVAYIMIHCLEYSANVYILKHTTESMFTLDSIFSLCSAICITVFFLSINVSDNVIGKVISFIGPITFDIYVVHMFIIALLLDKGINTKVYYWCIDNVPYCGRLIYTVLYTLIVFIISLIISIIIKGIKDATKWILKKGINRVKLLNQ